MYLLSAKGYKNADVHILIIKKTGKIWLSMKDSGSGVNVKNISDLVSKDMAIMKQQTLQRSKLTNTK